jgi:translation initiation factor IF-1
MQFSMAEIVQAQVEADQEIQEKHPNGRFNDIFREKLICNKQIKNKMKKVKLNVKDESVINFLKNNLTHHKYEQSYTNQENKYNMLKDIMYFKRNKEVNEGDVILIELHDYGTMSRKSLVNKYFYLAEKYDDVSLKMVLTDFKIELQD